MSRAFAMSISKGWMYLSISKRMTYWTTLEGYRTYDVLRSHLIKHEFMEDYRCWNKHGEGGLNEAEMIDSYLKWEGPTSVEEDHDDDVNKPDILGFIDDDIEL
jgi:hypothetical protein